MASDPKDLITEQTRMFLERIPESTLSFAKPLPLPSNQPISQLPYSRLIFVISGVKPISFSNGNEIVDVAMRPGDVLFAKPYGWSAPKWDKPHRFLSIVFNQDFIRFVYVKNILEQMTSPLGPKFKNWYHTSHELCRTGTLLLSACNAFASGQHVPERAGIEILTALMRVVLHQLETDEPSGQGKAYDTWQMIRDFMRENSQMPITRESVANHFRLNASYLSRLFQKHGEGFNQYLRRLRLEHARHLLDERQQLTIGEISFRCGFNSTGYFIKSFTQSYGTTPGGYRHTLSQCHNSAIKGTFVA
jgi:AraC-like DNA-binding protein